MITRPAQDFARLLWTITLDRAFRRFSVASIDAISDRNKRGAISMSADEPIDFSNALNC